MPDAGANPKGDAETPSLHGRFGGGDQRVPAESIAGAEYPDGYEMLAGNEWGDIERLVEWVDVDER
eukprot:CAMPEP_0202853232 /NCGR_PEP_ID=MMETSP1389-20130828/90375_1 /ASSEMBLY_ACC=CAM_ASM_000865 /TAXON_ID=302021 /ORGANISM="Rhodomonas sp., Strain CCMP768" /LENGTH=65 /DNA_ID=CAMNT_0049531775 /DNA_START=833 /DNA_END=1026 /DNA_ORIENTATION=+